MRSIRPFLMVSVMTFLIIFGAISVSALPLGPPPIKRPMDLYEATTEGASSVTVDYSICYDSASQMIARARRSHRSVPASYRYKLDY